MPHRSPYWLTITQTALELKLSTAGVRRLIRSGKLPAVEIDTVGVRRGARDSVEYVKQQLAAGHLRIPGLAVGGDGSGNR